MKSRSMVKLIHADDFYPEQDIKNLRNVVVDMPFEQRSYGYELPHFNLVFPDIEIILYKVLGERVTVDVNRSGVIRKPYNNAIHFEEFDTSEEWCFFVALEPTSINLWHHIKDSSKGDISEVDSTSVFDASKAYDFNNFFEWKIHTNILLEPNQGLFIRPWTFHSLESGLVQYHRLIADNNYRILVMGYPGSKKDSIAQKLSRKIENCSLIDSMQERINNKDVDFTVDGHMRHCYRLLNQARNSQSDVTIINMSCPLEKMRQILNPDIIVWVSDKLECEYEEANKIYEIPEVYDIECKDDSDEQIDNVIKRIKSKRI